MQERRKAQLRESSHGGLILSTTNGLDLELLHSSEEFGQTESYGAYLFIKGAKSLETLGRDNTPNIYKEMDEIKKKVQFAFAENDPDKRAIRARNADSLKNLFIDAGQMIYSELIPNQYCPGACCFTRPWLNVTTPRGHFTIGWRKRVIHLEWTRSEVRGSGKAIFPNEDVTRSNDWEVDKVRCIHAWGDAKAKEYIRKLHDPATLLIKKAQE